MKTTTTSFFFYNHRKGKGYGDSPQVNLKNGERAWVGVRFVETESDPAFEAWSQKLLSVHGANRLKKTW